MDELDPLIHVPSRLRIMTTLDELLDDGDRLTFPRLRELLGMTAGNLTTHLGRLEQAGYVVIEKGFSGRKPVTRIGLTLAGRLAFHTYRVALLKLIGGAS